MQMLSLNFFIYSIAGVWRPVEFSSSCAKLLYNAFSFFTIVMMYFFVVAQFMDIVLVVDNVDNFVTNSQMFVSIVSVCCKATVAVIRRNAIIGLVQTLMKEPCKPRDEDEVAIQMKFDGFIRSCSIKYSLLATFSVLSIIVKSGINAMQGNLPYRVWLPFDANVPILFWLTFLQQMISSISATLINVGTETLVFGFFLQTCAQLEIFESRLGKLVTVKTARSREHLLPGSSNREGPIISEYIRHHLTIYKYAKAVNRIFNQILFCQFFGSILLLCTCIYYLSSHITESETSTLIVYTICMFVQIYVYCWSGNEVILKSASVGNAVYNMDWTLLSISERKDLLMIMKRSTIPIKFTSSFLITLSLESYSNILKTSYSAFNVLQQS